MTNFQYALLLSPSIFIHPHRGLFYRFNPYFASPSLPLTLHPLPIPARTPNHPLHIPPHLRQRTRHLPRQDIPKAPKRLLLPLHQLVAPPGQLHKLASVDVRIAPRVDVLDQLGRDADGQRGGGGGAGVEVGEGGVEVCAGRY